MAVKIRLSRGGAKKRPFYRVVVADARAMRDGGFIEKIGTYNPMLPKDDETRVIIDLDRAKHWLGHGAQPTDRVSSSWRRLAFWSRRHATTRTRPSRVPRRRSVWTRRR